MLLACNIAFLVSDNNWKVCEENKVKLHEQFNSVVLYWYVYLYVICFLWQSYQDSVWIEWTLPFWRALWMYFCFNLHNLYFFVLFIGSRKTISNSSRICSKQKRWISIQKWKARCIPISPNNANHRYQGKGYFWNTKYGLMC